MKYQSQSYKVCNLLPKYISMEIPQDWSTVSLRELSVEHKSGIFKNQEFYGAGTNIVGVADLYYHSSIDGQLFRLVDLTEDEIKEYSLKHDDIIYGESSLVKEGIGKALYVTSKGENTVFAWHTRRIRLNPSVSSKYVYYALDFYPIRKSIISRSTTTALTGITTAEYFNTRIPIPPRKEQEKIVMILSKVDELIQKTDQMIEQTQRLKKALMQTLLTKGIGHTKFKKSELGEIPEHWHVAKLEDISLQFLSGGTPSTSNPSYWEGEIPWTRSAWITEKYVSTGERFITKLGLENSAAKIVPKDNVIVATRVSLGNVAINKVDIAINQDLTGILVDKSKFSTEFLYWFLVKNSHNIKLLSQGSTIPGITRDDLKVFKIICPPLWEQHKTASILSKIDELIKKQQMNKSNIENLKKGLMQKLLTGKIRVKV